MFSSWFGGYQASQARSRTQAQQRSKTIVTCKETHFEVIGGGAQQPLQHQQQQRLAQAPHRHEDHGPPRLPLELVTEIVFLAARAILLESRDDAASACSSSPSASTTALRLASINTLAYNAVVGNLLLRELILTGAEQVAAFAHSLRKHKRLARLVAAGKVKRLVVMQRRSRHEERQGQGLTRDSLYDARLRDATFAKIVLLPLRGVVLPLVASGLEELHIESIPTCLLPVPSTVSGPASASRWRGVREVTFTLSPWGGTRIPDVFRSSKTAWERLTSVQLQGSEGFRFCVSSALALASLPELRRVGMVMPSSHNGHQGEGEGYAEALRVLVMLTSGKLEELLVVGHDAEGWAGWSTPYRPALRCLRVARRGPGEASAGRRLRIKHITARLRAINEEDGAGIKPPHQHPSFFRSWIVARTAEQTQWEWPCRDAEEGWTQIAKAEAGAPPADVRFDVEWRCDEWEVPEEEPVSDDEENGERRQGRGVGYAEHGGGRAIPVAA
ncbi:hypothetical protein BDZ90DRAFT_259294 [Jaminaea rosea]|uniref:Uncharacterized protein n=1 Tax=Jaminaea rosea TaxID=1569628 RepID=A0A316UVE5_9BASI|nr:hypothetical protein BDZ90DRAFT_259294 [Jaminaea rosea]PWN29249.1 hypothetical protein BDZ90DRAFT_259294 [Jaminaea rosea]